MNAKEIKEIKQVNEINETNPKSSLKDLEPYTFNGKTKVKF